MKFVKLEWHLKAEKSLKKSIGNDLEFIKNQVKNKQAGLYSLFGKDFDLYIVIRIEELEMVIMCLEGRGLKKAESFILNLAKKAGCKSIRYHSNRKGLYRMLNNFKEVETIYRRII